MRREMCLPMAIEGDVMAAERRDEESGEQGAGSRESEDRSVGRTGRSGGGRRVGTCDADMRIDGNSDGVRGDVGA